MASNHGKAKDGRLLGEREAGRGASHRRIADWLESEVYWQCAGGENRLYPTLLLARTIRYLRGDRTEFDFLRRGANGQ